MTLFLTPLNHPPPPGQTPDYGVAGVWTSLHVVTAWQAPINTKPRGAETTDGRNDTDGHK